MYMIQTPLPLPPKKKYLEDFGNDNEPVCRSSFIEKANG